MATMDAARSSVRTEILRAAHCGLSLNDFVTAASASLAKAVPADGFCWVTLDPATLLPTSEIVMNGLPTTAIPRLTQIELRESDYNKLTALARKRRPAASLSQATEGNLELSRRQRELRRPNGFGDELRSVLWSVPGVAWGALTVMRERKRQIFNPEDVDLVASLSPILAEGVRRATLIGDAIRGAGASDAGVLLLSDDDSVHSADAAAHQWLDDLGASDAPDARLPLAIRAVAARARRLAVAVHDDLDVVEGPASGRLRTRSGRLVALRGSLLGFGKSAQVVVVLEGVQPIAMAPLVAERFGLTGRERAITELVARGLATKEISQYLHLSVHTVQDHLKSIFDKSGTTSRGELVASIFFHGYAPNLTSEALPW